MMKRSALGIGALFILLGGCSATSDGRPPMPEFDDEGITAAVKRDLIAAEPRTLAVVDVETLHRIVYLTGTVADEQAEQRAVAIARSVDGVDKVVNDLETE